MPAGLAITLLTLAFATVVLQFLIWRSQGNSTAVPLDLSPIQSQIELLRALVDQSEHSIRDEFSRLRQEQMAQSNALRESVTALSDSLSGSLRQHAGGNDVKLEQFRQGVEQRLDMFGKGTDQQSELLRNSVAESGNRLQLQVTDAVDRLQATLNQAAQQSREETGSALRALSGSVVESIMANTTAQSAQLGEIRTTMENRLIAMSTDNEKRLEQMRQTVDEKLQGTLDARLGASFDSVSKRLEEVHKGLGEMQKLASGVGDLKKVLTNVKTRGTWGEVQLGNLLEQMLAPEQYARNVNTTGTRESVEFAIKLPGREGEPCWLPIDSKFPVEDYQRLVEASENCDIEGVEIAARKLETTIKQCAKTISEKYLSPPSTTDFGILFLATEGLYAEALRRTGLAETLQRDFRVIITGPTTFAAILNSLQMGFHTLTIQQKSSDVWKTLETVKTQFAKYADVLSKVKKKLQEASHTVEEADRRTRVLQRELRGVDAPANGPNGDGLLSLALVEEDDQFSLTE